MKYFVLMDGTRVRSPSFTLRALLNQTDFTDQEVDSISSMMVGDTLVLDDVTDMAVKRVQE